MSSKDPFNKACAELAAQERRLAKALHQVDQARVRAIELTQKRAKLASESLPIDAGFEAHAAAAAAAAREIAENEGETVYWRKLFQATIREVSDARVSISQAEAAAKAAHQAFWESRFAEGVDALLERNRELLSDLYASFARAIGASEPEPQIFFEALAEKLRADDKGFRKAVEASFKTCPAPPRSTSITDGMRYAARQHMHWEGSPLREVPSLARRPEEIRVELDDVRRHLPGLRAQLDQARKALPEAEDAYRIAVKANTRVQDRKDQLELLQRRLSTLPATVAEFEQREAALAAELPLAEIEHAALAAPAGG